MNLWHATPDTGPPPERVTAGESVCVRAGTSPIQPGQSVWVLVTVKHASGDSEASRIEAAWERNESENSYWGAALGPFRKEDDVTYVVRGRTAATEVEGPTGHFRVGPRIYLAILWHQHQPVYKDAAATNPKGSYLYPWVRLHAIRDYYSMAALVAEHPGVHLTINLTPSLLWQIEDYLQRGATDRALELTRKPAGKLTKTEREELLGSLFDADWHNQIFPHRRYKELFLQRAEGRPFGVRDLRDLQMWFNLAWFGQEFRDGEVRLPTGERVSVRDLAEQERDFSAADIRHMVEMQYAIMRAVIPIHRSLQERGQIEVSATPFFHPILPLLIDTDRATIDRPGTKLPHRFSRPEDADAQVRLAIDLYRSCFGRDPVGMWPAEGAVSQFVVPVFARHGVRWIATDRGIPARSGRWGYRTEDTGVLCQPYRAEEGEEAVALFFRDTALSDQIGFHYYRYEDPDQAAAGFAREIEFRFARQLHGSSDRILTVVLDGENAWGAYPQDARPFLHALYGRLEDNPQIQTVTFG